MKTVRNLFTNMENGTWLDGQQDPKTLNSQRSQIFLPSQSNTKSKKTRDSSLKLEMSVQSSSGSGNHPVKMITNNSPDDVDPIPVGDRDSGDDLKIEDGGMITASLSFQSIYNIVQNRSSNKILDQFLQIFGVNL